MDGKEDFSTGELLKKFSPGTSLRKALDYLLRARMGALITIDKEGLSEIISGGFKINSRFTPQRLVEVAKMDGAIILSEDLKRITRINVLLSPDVKIPTVETGTRHQAAERTARQFNTIVVAVSERRNKISIYYGDNKYELEDTSEILRRATETLQVLEKQRETFDDQLNNLNLLEINDIVSISDVCSILQRIEIIRRISGIVKGYLIELGKEGIIVSMRLRELIKEVNQERMMILEDYFKAKSSKADLTLQNMNFDFLIETPNISKILFEQTYDKIIFPKGMRMLGKVNLSEKNIKSLINNFATLGKIFSADEESLKHFSNSNDSLFQDLTDLKEKIISGKRI